jgi:hypothetical protein
MPRLTARRVHGATALAFHVDYWDSLGWQDRFDSPLAVQRQQRYVEALGLASAFTPQVVVDGCRSLEVPLSSLPADATQVAVLVQHQGQGEILGAALVHLE